MTAFDDLNLEILLILIGYFDMLILDFMLS